LVTTKVVLQEYCHLNVFTKYNFKYMPWKVGIKTKKGFPIKKADTGKVVGYSGTKEKAKASVRARYANYKKK
jgi:hypothetical protein